MKIKTLSLLGLLFWFTLSSFYLYNVYKDTNTNNTEIQIYDELSNLKLKVQDLMILSYELFNYQDKEDHWLKKHDEISNLLQKLFINYRNNEIVQELKEFQTINENIKKLYLKYLNTKKDSKNKESFIKFQKSIIFSLNVRMNKSIFYLSDKSYKKLEVSNNSLSTTLATLTFLILTFTIIIFIFIWYKILKPHKQITEVINSYKDNNYKKRIEINSKDEIGEFSLAFNSMIEERIKKEEEIFLLNKKNIDEIKEKLKTKTLYEAILQNVNEAIILLDKQSQIILANNNFYKLFKTDTEKCKDFPENIFENSSLTKEKLNKAMRSALNHDFHLDKWVKIDNQEYYLDINFYPFYEEKNAKKPNGVLVTIKNITDKQLLKDNAKQQEQLIIQQSKLASMGEMLGAIAHQWRQPLSAIGGCLINLEEAYDYNELDKEYLTKQINSAERNLIFMSKTIDDFRNFFSPSKTKMDFCIKKSVIDALSIVKAQLHDNFISVKLFIENNEILDYNAVKSQEKYLVNGFPNEFTQVLVNIFANAKDAINALVQKKILIEGDGLVNIFINQDEENVTIEIEDNGGGIPQEILDRVFEPYFTTKDEGKGTGIGLYMSKMICENNMSSHLGVSNGENGAIFKITIKRVKDDI